MLTSPPTGTVTFLFTDIEGSVALAQHYPSEMTALLAQHQTILRQSILSNNGHIFQIIGDAYHAAFYTAEEALNAAVQAQRQLQQATWQPVMLKVRMGIHTGPAQVVSTKGVACDYTGYLTLARTQRIMSMAYGGQVLVSSTTTELLREGLPEGISLRDMGEYRLKGLLNSEHIWQIITPGLPSDFPPLQSFHTIQNNLPLQLSSFIGREREIEEVIRLLKTARLLTLTGPPGIGKTRLSIQVAYELLEHFEEGVCFIPLAPIHEPDLVARTIAQTLAIVDSEDRKTDTALKNYFHNKNMLLVLDNFEQVMDAAPMVIELLHSCPRLKILVTSRAPLKLSGERQYPLGPLRLPDLDHLSSIETLSSYSSISLFVDRANLVNPEFALTETNARVVAEICNHLDGMPLAIELSAAWIKLLSPQKLLAGLNNRLSLLTGGPVDLPIRQRTLRAAIDWSYELLNSWEKILLARLTIFIGGWTFEAAEAITGWSNPAGNFREGLLSLVDKSLVKRQERTQGHDRFTMLETICEYATEKLAAQGEKEILQQQHAAYYMKLAEDSEPALRGPEQQLWLSLLRDEHNNLRAALQWALENHNSEMALKLAGSLWRYWWMHGHLSEGRDWLESALALPGQVPALRARALNGAGVLARSQGDFTNARVFLEECLKIRRSLDDRTGMAFVLNSLGILAQYQGDYDQAFKVHEEALAYRREIGNQRDIAVSLNNLAMIAQEKGDFAQAEELYRESLTLFNNLNDARGMAATLANRGALMIDQGEADQAEAYFKDSLSILKDLGQRDDIIECLEGFAGVAMLLQQPKRAAHLLGAALALREVIGAPLPPYKRARNQRLIDSVTHRLDPKILESELMTGKEMSLNEAIEYALERNDNPYR